jgi:Mrp family chromosome partitioning ATPase
LGIIYGTMISNKQVEQLLETILVPGPMRSITGLNLIRDIAIIDDARTVVTLASTGMAPAVQDYLRAKVTDALSQFPDCKEATVKFVDATPHDLNTIGNVIAVMSGKGGVGKSLVTGLLAATLTRRNFSTGVLDADITGPSIPRMFGLHNARPGGTEQHILPVMSSTGIEIMSINLLLPNEDDAVIWRGPMIAKAIEQFWNDVLWGKLDFLVVDLPPGTSDAPLTVLQTLPVKGVVIVLSPQELASVVVRKAVKMAAAMNIPVLGIVENMSYFELPDSHKKIEIFGKSRADEMARAAGTSLVARIPLDPELARLCDDGKIEAYAIPVLEEFVSGLINSDILKGWNNQLPK